MSKSKGMMGGMGNRLMNRFFRPVDGVVWDLMTGKIGVKTSNGIACLEGEGVNAEIMENMFEDFGIELPAFAQNTPVDQIKVGDLIYGEKSPKGWIIKVPTAKTKTFTLLKPDGAQQTWRPPKVKSIGLDLSGAMVLRSLVNTLPEGGLGNMQNTLLPMMMMGGGDMGDLGDMLPMLLMSQTGMMGDAGAGGGGMMQTMMMMQMMKGGGFGGGGGNEPAFRGGSFFDK